MGRRGHVEERSRPDDPPVHAGHARVQPDLVHHELACRERQRRALRRRDALRAHADERPHEHPGQRGLVHLRLGLRDLHHAAAARALRSLHRRLDAVMEKWLGNGKLIKADTLDDLAKQLDIPADTFKATVERYNSMAEAGEDVDFDVPAQWLAPVKTAPFYATKNVCSTLTIPFGLHVNADSQVLTAEDEPIPGLFAIGNVQGDFFGKDYPVHCPGVSHGRCVTFGQLVGEACAKDTTIGELDFA
ncbi:MAG: FAD-binding protein [Eggerthella lenta]